MYIKWRSLKEILHNPIPDFMFLQELKTTLENILPIFLLEMSRDI